MRAVGRFLYAVGMLVLAIGDVIASFVRVVALLLFSASVLAGGLVLLALFLFAG